MKYHVITNTYGPGGRSGALVQAWDLEKIRQPYRRIFEEMESVGITIRVDDDLVFLIRG